MNDLLSKINIEDFRETIRQEIELDIDGTVLLQTWAERKSNNSVIKELFKNDLILSFPIDNIDLTIDKDYLQDMEDVFFERYKSIVSIEICKNKDVLFDKYKNKLFYEPIKDIFSVKDNFTSKQLTKLAYDFYLSDIFESLSEKLKLYVFLIINKKRIIESFISGNDQDIKCLFATDYYSLKMQKNEKLYRWFGRLIKKILGKNSIDFTRYDSLLTKLSSFKDSTLSKKNQMVLCLSIHPKDFFSVSKGNGWTSCFKYSGDYASSMSATLLSEDTIIAYTLKKEDYLKMKVSETYVPHKIWRSFVLINPLQILIVKGYPNHSTNIFNKIHLELQELLKTEYKSIDKIVTKDIEMFEPEIIIEAGYNDVDIASDSRPRSPSSWFLNTSTLEKSDWRTYITLSFQEMPMFLDTEKPFDFYTDEPSSLSSYLTLTDWENDIRCFDCDDRIGEEYGEVFRNEYDDYERCECCHDYFMESQEEE